jgi:hypothetical protein
VIAAVGTLQALIVSVVAVVVIIAGFCVALTLPKLRASGPHSRVIRSLDEGLGERQTYLAPDAPRGPIDQLRTPELLETQARRSA